tara:strand:+ start:205 stop:426 length:222 start_codon:yes stop_codon:yes gene_type:complete
MYKYIIRSLKIVNGEWLVDEQSFIHALNELKNRRDELSNLFHECSLKGWKMQDIDDELNDEFNLLITTINRKK